MPPINHRLVRDRRDKLDMSNAELASLLELATGSVENIVCGSVEPGMRTVHRLCRVLRLSSDDVLNAQDGENTPKGDPSEPPVQPPNAPTAPPRRQDTEKTKGPKRVTDSVSAA